MFSLLMDAIRRIILLTYHEFSICQYKFYFDKLKFYNINILFISIYKNYYHEVW